MEFSLVTAIKNRQIVTFYYDNRHRTVEPHTYGEFKSGEERLIAWQLVGKPGEKEDWRTFDMSKTSVLLATPQTMPKPRDGYVRDDPRMKRIYAQL